MTTVTAVLVSHDGARWLPRVLRHLDDLTRRPDRLVAIDTGSTDGSADLLREHLSPARVLEKGSLGFGEALVEALGALPPVDGSEWVWLLHDDSAPAPDALQHLLAGAATSPAPAMLGPKLREWPSLRRLLEVGATVSGTGRREVGLERGEYDQGQHDDPRQVLAVGSAGALVRRDVLETLGFDDTLPVTWSDLDLGWRVNRAGHVVRTVPDAVVFHADATRNGRRGPVRSPAARRQEERAGAIRTLLANTAGPLVGLVGLRLLVGGLIRALGLLLVRAPAEAGAEVRALVAVLARPDRIRRLRRSRRATAQRPHAAMRPLLAPWWTPYRHGLDEVTAVVHAYAREIRGRRPGREGTGPVSSPLGLLLVLVTVTSLWAGRHRWTDGIGSHPALLPPPASAWPWWDAYLSTEHLVGVGSTAAAAPYLLPAAALATLTWGSATTATHLMLLLSLPMAAWGAYRLFGRLVQPWLAAGLAFGYVLVVAMSGAPAQGRLGTLVAAALLPWAVASAGRLLSPDGEVRHRAVWRTALLLWAAASFVPGILGPALLGSFGLAAVLARRGMPRWGALVPVPTAAVLLLPWAATGWSGSDWGRWLDEAGSRYPAGVARPETWSLLLARPAEAGGAPGWLSAGIVVLALLVLLRGSTRPGVAAAWAAAVTGLGWGVAATALSSQPVWIGMPLVLSHGALLAAIAAGSAGLREELSGSAFGGRQLAGTVAMAVGATTLSVGTAWWVLADPVEVDRLQLPLYMAAASTSDPAAGTLVLRGDGGGGPVTFEVLRGGGPRLGDEAFLPDPERERRVAGLVTGILASPDGGAAEELAAQGVEFVLVPAPVDTDLAGTLDATPGLTAASAGDEEARAWRLDARPSLSLAGERDAGVRFVLVAVQLLALAVVVVLAAPGRRSRG